MILNIDKWEVRDETTVRLPPLPAKPRGDMRGFSVAAGLLLQMERRGIVLTWDQTEWLQARVYDVWRDGYDTAMKTEVTA